MILILLFPLISKNNSFTELRFLTYEHASTLCRLCFCLFSLTTYESRDKFYTKHYRFKSTSVFTKFSSEIQPLKPVMSLENEFLKVSMKLGA